MSDSHENWVKLKKAVAIANEENCEYLLFAGDLISPPGVKLLEGFQGKVKFVWGNNEAERVGITRKMDASKNIEMCGDYFEDSLDGKRFFMNHYPKFAELASRSGEYDIVIYGHTHEYYYNRMTHCIMLNPGEIQGAATGISSFVIYDTKLDTIEKIVIE